MSLVSAEFLKTRLFAPLSYDVSARLYVGLIALAVLLERFNIGVSWDDGAWVFAAAYWVVAGTLLWVSIRGIDRWFSLFVAFMIVVTAIYFRQTANHVYFALWLLAPLAFFPNGVNKEAYSDYVRRSLGVVMLVAATQKLISGNFLNGHFLMYLAEGGAINQDVLLSVCLGQPVLECDILVFLSILSVVWQYAIGFLLLMNCRAMWALVAEVVFVLSVGFVADEMNFQAINVATLLIAFRIVSSPLLILAVAGLLLIDVYRLEHILGALFG